MGALDESLLLNDIQIWVMIDLNQLQQQTHGRKGGEQEEEKEEEKEKEKEEEEE